MTIGLKTLASMSHNLPLITISFHMRCIYSLRFYYEMRWRNALGRRFLAQPRRRISRTEASANEAVSSEA